jgi:hypothetical protein
MKPGGRAESTSKSGAPAFEKLGAKIKLFEKLEAEFQRNGRQIPKSFGAKFKIQEI